MTDEKQQEALCRFVGARPSTGGPAMTPKTKKLFDALKNAMMEAVEAIGTKGFDAKAEIKWQAERAFVDHINALEIRIAALEKEDER